MPHWPRVLVIMGAIAPDASARPSEYLRACHPPLAQVEKIVAGLHGRWRFPGPRLERTLVEPRHPQRLRGEACGIGGWRRDRLLNPLQFLDHAIRREELLDRPDERRVNVVKIFTAAGHAVVRHHQDVALKAEKNVDALSISIER